MKNTERIDESREEEGAEDYTRARVFSNRRATLHFMSVALILPLIRANPYTLPSDIPRLMKGRSSHDLREEFPHLKRMPSLWTRSFFVSTAGNVSQDIIQKYIERQSKA